VPDQHVSTNSISHDAPGSFGTSFTAAAVPSDAGAANTRPKPPLPSWTPSVHRFDNSMTSPEPVTFSPL
jgi:hypothetical protein